MAVTGQPGGRRGDPNTVALLSLKLLLLGFFILLNALSQYEEDRARKVLESVNEAFNGRVDALESHAPHPAGLGALEETAAMIGAVGRLFRARIPAVRSAVSAEGTRLRLELPAETLFQPAAARLRLGRHLLLRRFAEALTANGGVGLDYEVELLHGVAAADMAGLAAAPAESLAVGRMGALARAFSRRGVPAGKLSIGVLPGRPGTTVIVVQVYDARRRAPDYLEVSD